MNVDMYKAESKPFLGLAQSRQSSHVQRCKGQDKGLETATTILLSTSCCRIGAVSEMHIVEVVVESEVAKARGGRRAMCMYVGEARAPAG